MRADRHLVKHAIASGFTVSVFDGEEWPVKRSTAFQTIMDAIESVDEAQLRIRDTNGEIKGWALVVNGLDDEELVADYSDNEFMREWEDQYSETV